MRNTQNEKLDRIGRRLLEAASLRGEEIERIAAAPQLFDSVKARIKAEQAKQAEKSFGKRAVFPAWNWQKTALAFGAMAVFAIAALGAFVFIKQDSSATLAEKVSIPEFVLPQKNFETAPPVEDVLAETRNFEKASVKKPTAIDRRADIRDKIAKSKKASRKPKPVKEPSEIEMPGEFYALNHAGNPLEAGENLQIIRTELSASSLFALGANVPIENATGKIKTDLLVGSDGVARAIRFVK